MKYVVLRQEIGNGLAREIPIIFPDALVHSDVANAIMATPGLDQSTVVSAGFLSSMSFTEGCHGESTTSHVVSRRRYDDLLIQTYDYVHGIVG